MFPQSYRWFILTAWVFVLAVTAYDIFWAIHYHASAKLWESNPVMLWVIQHYGVWTAGIARLSTVVFAASLMFLAPRRCQITATLTLVSIHTYLACVYAMILTSCPQFVAL
jgi:hypothetical protein